MDGTDGRAIGLRDDSTYYGRPLLKEPVWKPYIPLYYYVGGTAGASLVLGAAAQLDGSHELDRLIRRCHWIGIIGSSIGGLLLVADLGRPERFLAMLRVFRPTSPMNMGAWILAGAPSAAITAGLFARTTGVLCDIGEAAGFASGVFGAGLATYTGVLIANSAVPLWQEGRAILPVLFGASAMASSASIFDLLFEEPRACRITYMYGLAGRVAELIAGVAMERRVAESAPLIAQPLKRGLTGVAWKTAEALTAASLLTMLLPRQTRKKRVIAGALGTAGSLLLRFAVHYAGARSARDPRASFHPQRAGRGALPGGGGLGREPVHEDLGELRN